MSGKFSRRNPAMVSLSNEHTAILDAIAVVHYNIPRTRMVAALIDRALPLVVAELKKRDPEKFREIMRMVEHLKTHVEPTPVLSTVGVIDLAERRFERDRGRSRDQV